MGLFDRIRGGDDAPRVAFFGIDGVPYSLIADNPEEFENLTALIDEGTGGPIDSIVPPESSACWPALTSGVNPGETGIYGFQDREVGSYDTYIPMRRDFQATRVWDRVQEGGRDATVMNVVTTFPPQRDVQRMVSGFLSPSVDKAAYPDEFRDHLLDLDYPIDVNAGLGHTDKAEFMENAHETIDRRQEAFKHYVEQDDWDLFFGVFMATDRVNHFLFRDYEHGGEYAEEFVEFYRKVDRYLGELRDLLPDDVTMVVASDHGFTSLDYEVKCNAWLRENGWLAYEDDADYVFQLGAYLREGADPDSDGEASLDGTTIVAPSETVRDEIVGDLEDATPASLGVDHEDTTPLFDDVSVEDHEDGYRVHVDPADYVELGTDDDADTDVLEYTHSELGDIADETKAYSLVPGRFYINLEGREPRGSVPQEEYEAVRDELKEALEDMEGPDGNPVADRVVTKEEAFRGDHDDIAPDLVVVPNHGFDLKSGFKGRKDPFVEFRARNGMHSFDNATLVVDDDDVRLGDADLYDIAPTILDLMEIDYERGEFDGSSLV